jgi:hypothetical protein
VEGGEVSEPNNALDLAREWRRTADPARSFGIAERLKAIPLDAVDRLLKAKTFLCKAQSSVDEADRKLVAGWRYDLADVQDDHDDAADEMGKALALLKGEDPDTGPDPATERDALRRNLLDLDRLFRAEDMVAFSSLLETTVREFREKA